MARRILVDANIVLRYVQVTSPEYFRIEATIRRLISDGDEIFVTPQILREFWVVATRPVEVNGFGFDPSTAEESIELLLREFTLLDDEPGIFAIWLDLAKKHRVYGVKAHDANHAASALQHGVTHVLPLNPSDFQRYSSSNLVLLIPDQI